MNKEEIKFNINEDILYQIAMMSYNKYNNQIANANDHIGDIYSRQDIEEMEKCELEYEKHLGEIAIKQLQSQLTQANNKIEKIKEYVKDNGFGLYTRLCNGDTNIDLVESVEKDILSIIDGNDE